MRNSYPPQTATFIMPADFEMRSIYRCPKTNKQYDIGNLIEENLELNRKLDICRDVLMSKCGGRIAYETLVKMGELHDAY